MIQMSVALDSAVYFDDRGNGYFDGFGGFGRARRNSVAVVAVDPNCGGVSVRFRAVGQKGIVADAKIIVAGGYKHCRR